MKNVKSANMEICKECKTPEICENCKKFKKCENCKNLQNYKNTQMCLASNDIAENANDLKQLCNYEQCGNCENVPENCGKSFSKHENVGKSNENCVNCEAKCPTNCQCPCRATPKFDETKKCEKFTKIEYCTHCGQLLAPPPPPPRTTTATQSTSCPQTSQTDQKSISLPMFKVAVIKQSVTSVTIDWNLMVTEGMQPSTDVYKIEKYHKRRGWERVAWTSENPVTIENLEENFAYRFRISALKYDAEREEYVRPNEPTEFVASTLSALPSNISLLRAIKKGQQFLVKRILRRRPSLIEHPGPNGYLPLANAIINGETCIVDLLLTAGASIHNGHAANQRTPLHLAFFHGCLPVARMLLNKRADLEATDLNGMTACHFAIDANQFEMLKFGLECGANLEACDACGWTLLLRAVVMRSDVDILQVLVASGAYLEAVDKFGQSCVDLARLYRNETAMQFFRNNNKFMNFFK